MSLEIGWLAKFIYICGASPIKFSFASGRTELQIFIHFQFLYCFVTLKFHSVLTCEILFDIHLQCKFLRPCFGLCLIAFTGQNGMRLQLLQTSFIGFTG